MGTQRHMMTAVAFIMAVQRDDDYCGLQSCTMQHQTLSQPDQEVSFFFTFSLAQESYYIPACDPPKPCNSAID